MRNDGSGLNFSSNSSATTLCYRVAVFSARSIRVLVGGAGVEMVRLAYLSVEAMLLGLTSLRGCLAVFILKVANLESDLMFVGEFVG